MKFSSENTSAKGGSNDGGRRPNADGTSAGGVIRAAASYRSFKQENARRNLQRSSRGWQLGAKSSPVHEGVHCVDIRVAWSTLSDVQEGCESRTAVIGGGGDSTLATAGPAQAASTAELNREGDDVVCGGVASVRAAALRGQHTRYRAGALDPPPCRHLLRKIRPRHCLHCFALACFVRAFPVVAR